MLLKCKSDRHPFLASASPECHITVPTPHSGQQGPTIPSHPIPPGTGMLSVPQTHHTLPALGLHTCWAKESSAWELFPSLVWGWLLLIFWASQASFSKKLPSPVQSTWHSSPTWRLLFESPGTLSYWKGRSTRTGTCLPGLRQ